MHHLSIGQISLSSNGPAKLSNISVAVQQPVQCAPTICFFVHVAVHPDHALHIHTHIELSGVLSCT